MANSYILQETLISMLDAVVDTGGVAETCFVGLYTNADLDVSNRDLVYSDLNEPTDGGYATSGAITWGATAHSSQTDEYFVSGDKKTFSFDGDVPAEKIYGYFIATGGSFPTLLAIEETDAEGEVAEVDGVIEIVPRLGLAATNLIPDGSMTAT